MLEPALAAAKAVEKHVTLERKGAAEKPPTFLDEDLDLVGGSPAVPGTEVAEVGQHVLRATDLEFVGADRAGDDRRIDEDVVVGSAIVVRPAVGRIIQGRDGLFPGRRELQVNL